VKWFFLIVLIGGIAYASLGKVGALVNGNPEPLHESSYVVVYGRDTCGVTSRMLADLNRSGIPYEYKRVDEPQVADELHPRMEAAGLDVRRYGLPVVDVNAEMIIRPDPNTVAQKYQQFAQVSRTRAEGRSTTDAGPGSSAVAATQHTADPLVKCTVDGHQTVMLRSQCPQ
jgi:hypothetical protein